MESDGLSVEREGDEDLIISSRDFDKIAASRNKVVCSHHCGELGLHTFFIEWICGRCRGREGSRSAGRVCCWFCQWPSCVQPLGHLQGTGRVRCNKIMTYLLFAEKCEATEV